MLEILSWIAVLSMLLGGVLAELDIKYTGFPILAMLISVLLIPIVYVLQKL